MSLVGNSHTLLPIFQSLIGMLKTSGSGAPLTHRRMFQSLIGMLKTALETYKPSPEMVFQSLIGMLKTTTNFVNSNAKVSFNPS